MAKAPSIPSGGAAVPPPPPPPAPDSQVGGGPPAGTEPTAPPPAPSEVPQNGPGEIDGGQREGDGSHAVASAPLDANGQPQEGVPSPDAVATAEAAQRAADAAAASPNGFEPQNADLRGGVKAADYQPRDPDTDDEFAEVPEDKWGKRSGVIGKAAFIAGRRGTRLGNRRKSFTDPEWEVYRTAHQRGVVQREADEIKNDERRIIRIEQALGLAVPGAVIFGEDHNGPVAEDD